MSACLRGHDRETYGRHRPSHGWACSECDRLRKVQQRQDARAEREAAGGTVRRPPKHLSPADEAFLRDVAWPVLGVEQGHSQRAVAEWAGIAKATLQRILSRG